MNDFRVGDIVKCIDVDGATGRYLVLNQAYKVIEVVEQVNTEPLLALEGVEAKAYVRRFVLEKRPTMRKLTQNTVISAKDSALALFIALYLKDNGYKLAKNIDPQEKLGSTFYGAKDIPIVIRIDSSEVSWDFYAQRVNTHFETAEEFINWARQAPKGPKLREYETQVTESGLTVGCTTLSWSEFDAIVKYANEYRPK